MILPIPFFTWFLSLIVAIFWVEVHRGVFKTLTTSLIKEPGICGAGRHKAFN